MNFVAGSLVGLLAECCGGPILELIVAKHASYQPSLITWRENKRFFFSHQIEHETCTLEMLSFFNIYSRMLCRDPIV